MLAKKYPRVFTPFVQNLLLVVAGVYVLFALVVLREIIFSRLFLTISLFMVPALLFGFVYWQFYERIAGHSPKFMRYDPTTGYHLNKPVVHTALEATASVLVIFVLCCFFATSFGTPSASHSFLVSSIFFLCSAVYFAIRLNYRLQPARDERAANERQKEADERQQVAIDAQRAAIELRTQQAAHSAVTPFLVTQGLIRQKNIIIGRAQDSMPIYYHEIPGQEERFRNTYLIGTPGSGKTTCFANLNAQDFYHGNAVIVLSAEKRLFDRLLPLIPKERMDDLIYFDPADTMPPIIGFNPFTRLAGEDLNQKIGETITILKRAMGHDLGITMEPIIENAVAVLLRRPYATFADLMRLINPADKTVRNPLKTDPRLDEDARDFWQRYDTPYYRNSYDPIRARFSPFAKSPISTTLAMTSFSFKTVMNNGRHIIFLDLSRLRGNSPVTMGQLLLASIEQALLVRDDMREEDCIPYYLYIDEFQKYATDSEASLIALFNGARKYRLGITIAHQTTANIPTELMDTIDSDTSTKIVMHVEDKDARRFAPQLRIKKAGRDSFDPEVLEDLKTGQAYGRTPTHTIGIPITIPADPVVSLQTPISPDVLKARSKQNFGTHQNVPTVETEDEQPVQPKPPAVQKKPFGITFD